MDDPKRKAVPLVGVICVKEWEYALRDILHAVQEGLILLNTTMGKLVVYKDQDSGLLVCSGQLQIFREDKTSDPILPYDDWVSILLAREAHNEDHEGSSCNLAKNGEECMGHKMEKSCKTSCGWLHNLQKPQSKEMSANNGKFAAWKNRTCCTIQVCQRKGSRWLTKGSPHLGDIQGKSGQIQGPILPEQACFGENVQISGQAK